MNRLKRKVKRNVLFLTAAAVIFSVSGFGMGTTAYAELAAFDIDGNGEVDGGTDGLLFNRYLYGFRGSVLINAAVGQNCTRCTAPEIEAYLAKMTASSSDEGTFSNSLGMTFNLIPAGTFTMGSPGDEPGRGSETQHEVTLTQSFYIQTTEVTQGQWKAVMGSNPSRFSECGDNCPVEQVSWDDAQGFITKMNEMGEGTYRLPTEAEWEYAARAGTDTPFHFGQCLSTDQANYNGNNYSSDGCPVGEDRNATAPVASFEPNAYGLYDMHGNIREWCQDWFGKYPTGSVTDPTGPGTGSLRVERGGGWGNSAGLCRSAGRDRHSPGHRSLVLGFRLALSPGQ